MLIVSIIFSYYVILNCVCNYVCREHCQTVLENESMKRIAGIPIYILAICLVISGSAQAQDSKKLPDYQYGSVPFGMSMDKVLKQFAAANIEKKKTPYIESIGNYTLGAYFKGGIRKDKDQQTCFYTNVVQKYVVTDSGFAGVRELTLYFEGFRAPDKPYQLFMIKKNYELPKEQKGTLRKVFNSWSKPVTEAVGTKPDVRESTFQSFDGSVHDYYRPAMVGVWTDEEVLVFLMVADSQDGPGNPDVIIVSRKGLARYLEACKFFSDGK